MAKRFQDCVREAVRGGMLTEQEGQDALSWYNTMRAMGADDAKAKTEVAKQLELEAQERDRRAVKMAAAQKRIIEEVASFRNAAGDADVPLGWQMLHDRRGDEGRFAAAQDGRTGLSVKEVEDAILAEANAEMEAVAHEFRRGAITGDLKRQSKMLAKVLPSAQRTQARMSEVVKVMRGEKTTDAHAEQLAQIMMTVADKLRLRFNEAGGSIGKLENWGGPQSHNQDAVLRAGREPWITFTLGLLDRDKMVHTLTKRRLSDAELRDSLAVVWERIVTDGWVGEEKITGVPTGRGALYRQYADHRFLHFKSADAWQTYAKQYGNTDPWVSFTNWVQVMARDIAAMEKFGPNPTVTREYMKQWIKAQSMRVKPAEAMIAEEKVAREQQTARLKDLQSQMVRPNPDWEALTDRHGVLLDEINALRHSHVGMASVVVGAWNRDPGPEVKALRDRMAALHTELLDVTQKMLDMEAKGDQHLVDATLQKDFSDLLEEMAAAARTDPIRFAETDNPTGYAATTLQRVDAIWEFERGALNAPLNSKTANVMATARNTVTATALGQAILSAITDTAFQSVRRGFVGMAASKANPVTVLIETLKAIGTENRRYAVRSNLILDSAMHAWQREAANATGWAKARSATSYVADRVMSLQGLNAWTQGGKHAFGLELMGHVADEAGKAWGEINPGVREMLQRAGFDAAGWDQIRAAKLDEPKPGATFLRPNEIHDISPDLAQRYTAMLLRETRYAIIEPTPTAKSIMLGGTRPGTVAGELVRGAGQLKTFPVTVLLMHMGQTASLLKGGDRAGSARYLGAMLITGTVMGALAMTLKDINAGRDPRKWLEEETYLDPNFWGAALLQSGGLGLYSDFLFAQANRFGGGWAKSLAGPLVDRAETFWNLTGGNILDLTNNVVRQARGEQPKNTRFAAELTKFMRQNFPSVVWNKLVMERMVWDQMQLMIDPEARQAFQRQTMTRRRDYGQDFYWQPGEMAPSRAPDLGRMFATRK